MLCFHVHMDSEPMSSLCIHGIEHPLIFPVHLTTSDLPALTYQIGWSQHLTVHKMYVWGRK